MNRHVGIHYFCDVVKRYLRLKKYTCLDRWEHADLLDRLSSRFFKKYIVPRMPDFHGWGIGMFGEEFWINGTYCSLEPEQVRQLRQIDAVRRKLIRLDEGAAKAPNQLFA